MQAVDQGSTLVREQAKPADNQAPEKPSLPLAATTTIRQQLPASPMGNRVPAIKAATATSSTSQEQPPAAPMELKAPAIKPPAVYTGSTPTQQPAAAITSTHPATTASAPIKPSTPKQPPVGNKRTPAPSARGGAPVTGPSPAQQQPAPATRSNVRVTNSNTASTAAPHKQQPAHATRTYGAAIHSSAATAASPQKKQLASSNSNRRQHSQTSVSPVGPTQMQQPASNNTNFPAAAKRADVTSAPTRKQPPASGSSDGLSAAKRGATTSGCNQQQKKTAAAAAPQRPAAQGTKAVTGARHSHSKPQPSAWARPRPQTGPTARGPSGVMPPAAKQTQNRSAVSIPGVKPTLPITAAAARSSLLGAGAQPHLPSSGSRSAGTWQQTSHISYARAAATGVAPQAAQGCLILSKSPLDVVVEHYLTRKKDSKEQVAEDARIVNSLSEMATGQHRIRSFRRIAGKLLRCCI